VIPPALAPLVARIEGAYPGRFESALAAHARRHGLAPAGALVTPLHDRGPCLSAVVWRQAEPAGTWNEHQLLVIPVAGDVVPEKRHFRCLANPGDPGNPWVVIGDEWVTGLTGVLVVEGSDVSVPSRVTAGHTVRSYGCAIEAATGTIRVFQDRHALCAKAAWTAVIFQHRYTTLRRLETELGADHPDLVEVRSRGPAVPG
jgi:hypothetical protein